MISFPIKDIFKFCDLQDRIKSNEGYRKVCYKDTLGNRTIGYGHLVTPQDNIVDGKEYSDAYLESLFKKDLSIAWDSAISLYEQNAIAFDITHFFVIVEMVFQLGKSGVAKFKKMWEALSRKDYEEASRQMLDSRWHKQTPKRCEELAAIMASCK